MHFATVRRARKSWKCWKLSAPSAYTALYSPRRSLKLLWMSSKRTTCRSRPAVQSLAEWRFPPELRVSWLTDKSSDGNTIMTAEMGLMRPETLRHQVENVLRQAIMSGRFAPGARLIERELCETLGVSRTSVREALRRLEAEKLVRIVPHKGPTVAVISKQEAAELYAIRGLLEGYAAAEFTRHANDASIVRFGEGAQALKVAALSGNQAAVLKAKSDLYD